MSIAAASGPPSTRKLELLSTQKMVINFSSNNNNNNNNTNKRESEFSMERSSISTNSSSKSSSNSSSSTATSTAASKFSKIGRRLRESCRNLRGKNNSDRISANVEDYKTMPAPNDSLRTKHYVAMDFSGKVGRIVDHKDIRGIPATKDGYTYFRRKVETPLTMTENQASIHKKQKWFHPNLSRDQAQRVLVAHGIDGVFLVRDSSVSGGFVISYIYNSRIYHVQVLPDCVSDDNIAYYSLDEGKTKFFDLLQMIEYYQLNQGSLNTKLKYYIVFSPKADEQEQEQGQAVSDHTSPPSPPPRPPTSDSKQHLQQLNGGGVGDIVRSADDDVPMDTNQNTKVANGGRSGSLEIIQTNGGTPKEDSNFY